MILKMRYWQGRCDCDTLDCYGDDITEWMIATIEGDASWRNIMLIRILDASKLGLLGYCDDGDVVTIRTTPNCLGEHRFLDNAGYLTVSEYKEGLYWEPMKRPKVGRI